MIDFKKHSEIKSLEKYMPIKIHAIMVRHDESCSLEIGACFFYKGDAEKALEWLLSQPNDGCTQYEIKETKLTRYREKGEI